MNEIVMPKLSDTMTEGRLVSWKKRVGDEVRRGEVIAEVETDKANMELEAYASGVLLEIKVQPGELVQVGTVIAVIGKAGEKGAGAPAQPAAGQQPREEQPPEGREEQAPVQEEAPGRPAGEPPAPETQGAAPQEGAPPQEAPPQAAQEEPREAPPQEPPPEGATAGTKPAQPSDLFPLEGEKQAPAAPPVPGADGNQPSAQEGGGPKQYVHTRAPAPGGPAPGFAPAAGEGRERAAPVVRRRARELGIDLGQVQGSGPEGRILLQDLKGAGKVAAEGAQGGARPERQPAPPQPAQPAASGKAPRLVQEVKALSRLRAAVAKTVAESWEHIPHFTVTMEIIMDEAESIRRQLKQSGMRVTVNDVIVKAVALALQKFPQMNARFTPEGLQFHGEINVSVAVGVPEGVLMPVITGCQHRSLLEIAQEADRLVQRARAGSLSEHEMNGGTFSVSNLGMFNVSSFSAVIHPSQAGVLAVGAVVDAPVVRSGSLASAKVMMVTLSADHRVVDGAYAAEFLVALKETLENPVRLLL